MRIAARRRPLVLKVGGELLEDRALLAGVVSAVARMTIGDGNVHAPLVIIHGGGKEIDAALKQAGLEKRQVDGLRITDGATLEVVVAVLGAVNTRLVAALNTAGVPAVGLTGADANCGLSELAAPHRAAGRVGVPAKDADMRLLESLVGDRFVPVVACIGIGRDGTLLNVNADTLAGHLAARLSAKRLVIAGTTPGVLGRDGATLPLLESTAFAQLVSSGTATAGMIAKLRACEHALAGGVDDVVIVDGRDAAALVAAAESDTPPRATRLIADCDTNARLKVGSARTLA
ncbi:MAG: acetylglutamate kinase [Acidobacteria bacterium]|nr:MAG: acetylglutamate kinase [Acidobacteriota bacterium]